MLASPPCTSTDPLEALSLVAMESRPPASVVPVVEPAAKVESPAEEAVATPVPMVTEPLECPVAVPEDTDTVPEAPEAAPDVMSSEPERIPPAECTRTEPLAAPELPPLANATDNETQTLVVLAFLEVA